MSEKKITKREVINAMLNEPTIAENELYAGFLNHELELLDNKAKSKRKVDEVKAQANAEVSTVILEVLGSLENGGTVSEIKAKNDVLLPLSTSAVTARLKELIATGEVVNVKESAKRSIYKLA